MNSTPAQYYLELLSLTVFSFFATIGLVALYFFDIATGVVPREVFLMFAVICGVITIGAGLSALVYKSAV